MSESSLSKVRVGQPAEITLDALPDVALPRPHQPDGADRRSRQGDGDDQGAVRAHRSARAAGDERQGGVPVAGGRRPSSSSRCSAVNPDALVERDGRTVCSSCATGQGRPRCRSSPGSEDRRPGGDHRRGPLRRQGGAQAAAGSRGRRARPGRRPSSAGAGKRRGASDMTHERRRQPRRADEAAGRDPPADEVLRARRPGHPGAGRHQPRRPRGRVRRADGAVGLGQVDAAQPHRRHRQAELRARSTSPASTSRSSATPSSPPGAPRTSASSSSSTT